MVSLVEGECQCSESRIESYLSHDEVDYRKLQTISETMRENEPRDQEQGSRGQSYKNI